MKKVCLILILVVVMTSLAFSVCATTTQLITAEKVSFPIQINDKVINKSFSMISFEDRAYVQLRELCDYLDIGVSWNERERKIEIRTDRVEVGYGGIKEWNSIDIGLTEKTAIAIADAVFLQTQGEKFINDTEIKVKESDEGSLFVVSRYYHPLIQVGGGYTIIVRKSDGKIMKIIAEE